MWKEACLPFGAWTEFQKPRLKKSSFLSLGKLLGCENDYDAWTEEDPHSIKWASFTGGPEEGLAQIPQWILLAALVISVSAWQLIQANMWADDLKVNIMTENLLGKGIFCKQVI